jgi:hypothetical protein
VNGPGELLDFAAFDGQFHVHHNAADVSAGRDHVR